MTGRSLRFICWGVTQLFVKQQTSVASRLTTLPRLLVVTIFVFAAASCSTLPTNDVVAEGATTSYVTTPPTSPPATTAPTTTAESGPTTAAPTTPVPTTAVPTTVAPTTAAPTTAPPTTAAPATVAPTTAPATTVPSTTAVSTTVAEDEELEELPYTGPREAVLFALIGLAMIVAGRTVLDLFGVLSRFDRVGENLPPR